MSIIFSKNSTISLLISNSKCFVLPKSFFIFILSFFKGLKSETAAAHMAISTGNAFLPL